MIWNLGCGDHKRPLGFRDCPDEPVVNIDCRKLAHVDEVCDVRDLSAVVARRGRPEKIAAEDVLEHLPRADAAKALRHWCDILAPGGTLHVRTLDLRTLVEAFAKGKLPPDELERRLYGKQDYPENTHACGFTRETIAALLTGTGMTDVRFESTPPGLEPFAVTANLWVYARKPNNNRDPKPPQIVTTLRGPHCLPAGRRVLITTPWTAQGLTTMAVYLGRLLESFDYAVDYHAWRHPKEAADRYEAPGWPEDTRVIQSPFDDLQLSNYRLIVWPEVVETSQVEKANAAGCRTAWVPMAEFINRPHPVDIWAPWSVIIAPTRACCDLLAKLGRASQLCSWWCDFPLHEPRETPPEPIFFHCIRGLCGDIRNTTAVVRAWSDYKRTGGRGKLVIKSMRPLREVVQQYALPKDCEIIEETLPAESMAALYANADVFLYPTKREGLGLVILEALCAGLPVVTTDAPPMTEWVGAHNGRLVKPGIVRAYNEVSEYVVQPDQLVVALRELTPTAIADLKRGVHAGLEKRRMAFVSYWRALIDGLSVVPRPDPMTISAEQPVPMPMPMRTKPVAPLEPPKSAALAKPARLVTICMVTCNRLDLTKRTVESVEQNTPNVYRWAIVDNGSTDGTVEWLRDYKWTCPADIAYWPENRGKAAALNHAMQRVDTPWFVTLDNDVLVPRGWLPAAIEKLRAFPAVGIVALSAEPIDYPIVEGTQWFGLKLKHIGNVNGACGIMSRSLIDRIGYHSLAYGLGGYLDWEWSLRVQLSGLAQGYLPNHRIEHIGDQSTFNTVRRKTAGRLWHERSAAFISGKVLLYIGPDGKDTGPQWTAVTPGHTATRTQVLVVSELLGNGRGGGTLAMIRLLAAVHKRGHDITNVYQLAVGPWPKWIRGQYLTDWTPYGFHQYLSGLDSRPDILIGDSACIPPVICEAAALFGIPFVTYIQFPRGLLTLPEGFALADVSPIPPDVYNAAGLHANRQAVSVIANSSFTARLVRELLGVEPAAIVHPPLQPASLVIDKSAMGGIKPVYERPYVLTCSPVEARGARTFVKLARCNRDLQFLMLAGGKGGDHQEGILAEARTVSNLTVRDDWQTDMGSVYAQACCVFIGSSTTETFGCCAAEARTNGIPIIANAVGHLPEIVTEGAGVLVPRGAGIEKWQAALEKALRLRPKPTDQWNQDHTERFADIIDGVLAGEPID